MLAIDNSDLIAQLNALTPQMVPPVVPAISQAVMNPSVPVTNNIPTAITNNSENVKPNMTKLAVKKETIMDVTVDSSGFLMLNQGHADIRREIAKAESDTRRDVAQEIGTTRREIAEGQGTIRYDAAMGNAGINDSVKSSAWAVSDRVGTEADRVVAQDTAYFIAAQGQNFSTATALAALKATQDAAFVRTQADIQMAALQAVSAATLSGEKAVAASALGNALLGQQIISDGNTTRMLINDLKNDQLNRELIERNAFLVESRGDARFWRAGAENAQLNAVTTQLNAFGSQLQETRQGMVNFGSMTGVGQTSTANSVR